MKKKTNSYKDDSVTDVSLDKHAVCRNLKLGTMLGLRMTRKYFDSERLCIFFILFFCGDDLGVIKKSLKFEVSCGVSFGMNTFKDSENIVFLNFWCILVMI